jgi:ABC-type Mn2+/Zn2+ transport system ATPase subunit
MPRRSSDISASPLAPCRVSRQVTAPATTRFPKKTEEQTKQRREIQIGYLPQKKTNKKTSFTSSRLNRFQVGRDSRDSKPATTGDTP